MKKYLVVEFGSRGEMLVEGIVESSLELLEKENLEFLENCDEEEKEYYEEFMYVYENEEVGSIGVGKSEEESYLYIDCDMNKEIVERILEINKLVEEDSINYEKYSEELNDILSKVDY